MYADYITRVIKYSLLLFVIILRKICQKRGGYE